MPGSYSVPQKSWTKLMNPCCVQKVSHVSPRFINTAYKLLTEIEICARTHSWNKIMLLISLRFGCVPPVCVCPAVDSGGEVPPLDDRRDGKDASKFEQPEWRLYSRCCSYEWRLDYAQHFSLSQSMGSIHCSQAGDWFMISSIRDWFFGTLHGGEIQSLDKKRDSNDVSTFEQSEWGLYSRCCSYEWRLDYAQQCHSANMCSILW